MEKEESAVTTPGVKGTKAEKRMTSSALKKTFWCKDF